MYYHLNYQMSFSEGILSSFVISSENQRTSERTSQPGTRNHFANYLMKKFTLILIWENYISNERIWGVKTGGRRLKNTIYVERHNGGGEHVAGSGSYLTTVGVISYPLQPHSWLRGVCYSICLQHWTRRTGSNAWCWCCCWKICVFFQKLFNRWSSYQKLKYKKFGGLKDPYWNISLFLVVCLKPSIGSLIS